MEKMGPAPTTGEPADPRLSERRAAVLHQLRLGPDSHTVSELATLMSLHPNTVREHLDALVDMGMARRDVQPPSGRGRPAWRYTATPPPELDVRIRDYAGLASVLAGHIARTSPDPGGDAAAAGMEWGRSLARALVSTPVRTASVRHEVVGLLDDLGFAPAPDRRGGTVRLRQCPLLEAAEQHPEVVCAVHLGIVQGAVGELGGDPARASLRAFAEPGACVLELDSAGTGG